MLMLKSANFVLIVVVLFVPFVAIGAQDITVTDSVLPTTDLTVVFGDATDQTITITNDGDENLVLGTVSLAEPLVPPFSLQNDACSAQILAEAASCTFDVRFSPVTASPFSASIDIPSNDPDENSVIVNVWGLDNCPFTANVDQVDTDTDGLGDACDVSCNNPMIDGGVLHTVGLRSDGTLTAVGNDTYGQIAGVSEWNNLVAVTAGGYHTVGLQSDGTVLAAGYDASGQVSGVSGWSNLVAITAGGYHTVGLLTDGTVVAVGRDSFGQVTGALGWAGVAALAAGNEFTVGLLSDGKVLAVGEDSHGQVSGVSGWSDVVAVAAGLRHTVGLRSNGTVVAAGYDVSGQVTGVSGWSNIVAIAAGANHTVGLRSDGTVVAVGYDFYSQVSAVNGWSSILSIAGGGDHTVGLGSDGTVVAVGRNSYSQVTGVNERFLGFLVQDADSDGQPDTCDTGDSDGDGLPDNIDPDPLAAPSFSDVTPTTYWSDFSGAATVADYDAEIGDIIAVFDPQGVACGKYVVDAAGQYGFLPAYGDDPDTQTDEGAVAGDVLTFRVWDVSAQQELRATTTVVSGALPVVWQDQTISIVDINGLKNRTVSIPLRIGWNLVSIPLAMVGYVNAPPSAEVPINTRMEEVDSIDDIFASIAGQYSLIRSFDSFGAHTYDPDLPSFINTLKYVSGGYGYWFKMMEPGLLILNGPPQLPSDTLLLAAGWNLVGYWGDVVKYVGSEPVYAYPGGGVSYSSVNSVSDILSSLSDSLNLVRSFDSVGAHTYDPLLPPFINTLSYMGPGYSYWIKLNAGAALQFGETQP